MCWSAAGRPHASALSFPPVSREVRERDPSRTDFDVGGSEAFVPPGLSRHVRPFPVEKDPPTAPRFGRRRFVVSLDVTTLFRFPREPLDAPRMDRAHVFSV